MQTANYLDQAKSFLNKNALRMALRAVPLALMAVAAHAASNTLIFSAPNSTSVSDNCSGVNSITTPLAGASVNGGLGLSLSGDATVSADVAVGTPCTLTMTWSGIGSGLFGGTTGSVFSRTSPGFTITPGTDVFVTGWNLSVLINGNAAGQVSCTTTISNPYAPGFRAPAPRNNVGGINCSLPASPSGTFAVPSTLSTWQVILQVSAIWDYGDGPVTLEVTVPPALSIDLLAAQGSPSVPALTPLVFCMTAILLLSLAGFGILRRNSSGSGFPG